MDDLNKLLNTADEEFLNDKEKLDHFRNALNENPDTMLNPFAEKLGRSAENSNSELDWTQMAFCVTAMGDSYAKTVDHTYDNVVELLGKLNDVLGYGKTSHSEAARQSTAEEAGDMFEDLCTPANIRTTNIKPFGTMSKKHQKSSIDEKDIGMGNLFKPSIATKPGYHVCNVYDHYKNKPFCAKHDLEVNGYFCEGLYLHPAPCFSCNHEPVLGGITPTSYPLTEQDFHSSEIRSDRRSSERDDNASLMSTDSGFLSSSEILSDRRSSDLRSSDREETDACEVDVDSGFSSFATSSDRHSSDQEENATSEAGASSDLNESPVSGLNANESSDSDAILPSSLASSIASLSESEDSKKIKYSYLLKKFFDVAPDDDENPPNSGWTFRTDILFNDTVTSMSDIYVPVGSVELSDENVSDESEPIVPENISNESEPIVPDVPEPIINEADKQILARNNALLQMFLYKLKYTCSAWNLERKKSKKRNLKSVKGADPIDVSVGDFRGFESNQIEFDSDGNFKGFVIEPCARNVDEDTVLTIRLQLGHRSSLNVPEDENLMEVADNDCQVNEESENGDIENDSESPMIRDRNNLTKWRVLVEERIKKSELMEFYDVVYSTERLMRMFPEENNENDEKVLSLLEICENASQEQIARNFFSIVLLANDRNIEIINQDQESGLFDIKLLTRHRPQPGAVEHEDGVRNE